MGEKWKKGSLWVSEQGLSHRLCIGIQDIMGIFQVMRWGIFITHFLHVMSRELPDYKEKFKTGEIGSVLSWLKTKIHNLWNMHDPLDFIEKVTGGPLNPHYFIDYLDLKYTQIYDLG